MLSLLPPRGIGNIATHAGQVSDSPALRLDLRKCRFSLDTSTRQEGAIGKLIGKQKGERPAVI